MVHRRDNTKPEAFDNVKVYASDPWYFPVDGTIRNLSISSKSEPSQGNHMYPMTSK